MHCGCLPFQAVLAKDKSPGQGLYPGLFPSLTSANSHPLMTNECSFWSVAAMNISFQPLWDASIELLARWYILQPATFPQSAVSDRLEAYLQPPAGNPINVGGDGWAHSWTICSVWSSFFVESFSPKVKRDYMQLQKITYHPAIFCIFWRINSINTCAGSVRLWHFKPDKKLFLFFFFSLARLGYCRQIKQVPLGTKSCRFTV